jgi:hypothetical protein
MAPSNHARERSADGHCTSEQAGAHAGHGSGLDPCVMQQGRVHPQIQSPPAALQRPEQRPALNGVTVQTQPLQGSPRSPRTKKRARKQTLPLEHIAL